MRVFSELTDEEKQAEPGVLLAKLEKAFAELGMQLCKASAKNTGEVDALDDVARELHESYTERLHQMAKEIERKAREHGYGAV
jgi:hypothetical protein